MKNHSARIEQLVRDAKQSLETALPNQWRSGDRRRAALAQTQLINLTEAKIRIEIACTLADAIFKDALVFRCLRDDCNLVCSYDGDEVSYNCKTSRYICPKHGLIKEREDGSWENQ